MNKILATAAILIALVQIGEARLLRVPSQYSTIQAGINASVNGDTVLVADGTYTGEGNKNLDFSGRAIVLISENGPDSCVIDLENFGRGFYFHSGESLASLLSGFKIVNGYLGYGWPEGGGAGIQCANGSSPTIENCVFNGNSADEHGGAIWCNTQSNPVIKDCVFNGNSSYYGGGIYCTVTSPTILNCIFNGNSAGENGGGVCCFHGSTSIIENCIFTGNTAMFGGGIKCWNNSSPTIKNCLLYGNSASDNGGGIGCAYWCQPTITNCTVVGNSTELGGGISSTYDSELTGANNIVWGNTATAGSQVGLDDSSTFSCAYSCIQGGWQGMGNIAAEPLFAACPLGDYYLSQTASGQPVTSPCVDAGNPASPVIIGTTRTDGLQDQGVVDMGYHYRLPAAPPALSIALHPHNPPILIPAGGGSFDFDVELVNRLSRSFILDVWSETLLPGSGVAGPLFIRRSLNVPANVVITRRLTQFVPGYAPYGYYTYIGKIGIHPDSVIHEDRFDFTKLAGESPPIQNQGWTCCGWDAEDEFSILNSQLIILNSSPNPFNQRSLVSFTLPREGYVQLAVYDIQGREIALLAQGFYPAGHHSMLFNGAELASGMYFARLEAGKVAQTRKLLLLK